MNTSASVFKFCITIGSNNSTTFKFEDNVFIADSSGSKINIPPGAVVYFYIVDRLDLTDQYKSIIRPEIVNIDGGVIYLKLGFYEANLRRSNGKNFITFLYVNEPPQYCTFETLTIKYIE